MNKFDLLPFWVRNADPSLKISISEAKDWHQCAMQAAFKRVHKIKKPLHRNASIGIYVDAIISTDVPKERLDIFAQVENELGEGDAEKVSNLVTELLDSVDSKWLKQYGVYARLPVSNTIDGEEPYCFYGFADFFDGIDFLCDLKCVGENWKPEWKTYWSPQAQAYIWALQRMGFTGVKRMNYIIANIDTGVISLDGYVPKQPTVDKVPNYLLQAINIRNNKLHGPLGDSRACSICQYIKECDAELWGTPIGGDAGDANISCSTKTG